MDPLVQETRGTQPARRLVHASLGVVLAGWIAWTGGRGVGLAVLACLLAVALLLDAARLTRPVVNRTFFRVLRPLASPRERDRIASSTWYLVGVFIVAAVFEPRIAAVSVLVLALADSSASYIGRRWGRRRVGNGSVLGTTVFTVVATVCLSTLHPLPLALPVAALVAAAEILPLPLDDNLTVPVACAGLQWLLLGL